MQKTPRLGDLYVLGRNFTVKGETPDGEVEIPVWLQKLNPSEHEKAFIAANSARAVVYALKREHDLPNEEKSKQFLAIETEIDEISQSKEALVDLLAMTRTMELRVRREQELAHEEEWHEGNYYQGLVDAWLEELQERFEKNPEDPEAKRVQEELARFNQIVEQRVEKERNQEVQKLLSRPDEVLRKEAIDMLIESQSDAVWVNEFRRHQIYYATRDPETKERYFNSVEEVFSLDPRIELQLNSFMDELNVDSTTGKSSQELQDSSD